MKLNEVLFILFFLAENPKEQQKMRPLYEVCNIHSILFTDIKVYKYSYTGKDVKLFLILVKPV